MGPWVWWVVGGGVHLWSLASPDIQFCRFYSSHGPLGSSRDCSSGEELVGGSGAETLFAPAQFAPLSQPEMTHIHIHIDYWQCENFSHKHVMYC